MLLHIIESRYWYRPGTEKVKVNGPAGSAHS